MSRRVALATLTLNAGVWTLPVIIVAYISDVIASCLQSIGRMNDVGDQLQVTVVGRAIRRMDWSSMSVHGYKVLMTIQMVVMDNETTREHNHRRAYIGYS